MSTSKDRLLRSLSMFRSRVRKSFISNNNKSLTNTGWTTATSLREGAGWNLGDLPVGRGEFGTGMCWFSRSRRSPREIVEDIDIRCWCVAFEKKSELCTSEGFIHEALYLKFRSVESSAWEIPLDSCVVSMGSSRLRRLQTSISLLSSPTLLKRYVRPSQRRSSKAKAETNEEWPWHRATTRCSHGENMVNRSSCPPV